MFVLQRKEIKPIHGPKAPWLLIVIFLLLMAAAVSYFGDRSSNDYTGNSSVTTSTPDPRSPRIYTVSYKSGVFSPTNLRIHAGDTVRFKNEDYFGIHIKSDASSISEALPGFDSIGDIPQNSYFSFTFSEKGIFGYHNENSKEEAGIIIVR